MADLGGLENFYYSRNGEYTDEDFKKMENQLRYSGASDHAQSPRLYAILLHMGCEKDMNVFQKKGLSDSSLPLSQTQLPSDFTEGWKIRYLQAQKKIIKSSNIVRMMGLKEHMTLARAPDYFKPQREFGRGAYGVVDKVLYTVGGQIYARKRILRQLMQGSDASAARAFANEVKSMKSINHHHCVELVASYTDPQFFAFLMLPVAECNLARYLEVAILNQETRSFLPSFFGCLSRGLWHIHQQKLRHRDIKPENILVSDNKVLFADFGCAHDWSHTLHSTTVGVPPRTQQYASPEVAYSGFQNGSRINSSSDIWSLGCVFLEIANVWKKQSVAELDYLKHPGYYQNIRQVRGCLEQLRTIESRPSISGALDWIQEMLQVDSTLRPTAQRLVELTSNFCCLECRSQDNRQITENRTLEESESNDENNVERLESDRIVQFDIQERSTSPSNAKGRVANESNIITAVCKEMGKDPRSLSEEQEGFIVATYNFVLKRVVGLN